MSAGQPATRDVLVYLMGVQRPLQLALPADQLTELYAWLRVGKEQSLALFPDGARVTLWRGGVAAVLEGR